MHLGHQGRTLAGQTTLRTVAENWDQDSQGPSRFLPGWMRRQPKRVVLLPEAAEVKLFLAFGVAGTRLGLWLLVALMARGEAMRRL
jgi:hypothetical protein